MIAVERPIPVIRRVLHPSDFSNASDVAFAHALKTALIVQGKLALLHIASGREQEATEFPGVRETLERWKLLPAGSGRDAVHELGIEVAKVLGQGPDPAEGVLHYLQEHETDLIVLATHHQGFDWLHRSISEPVARKSGEMTLFIPASGRGFVSPIDGAVWLHNVLIPIAEKPGPEAAIAGAIRVVHQLRRERGKFTLLHVGENEPAVQSPDVPGWTWQRLRKEGDVIDAILETARETNADLIVMTTDGRNGFLDALRGSHSERVLRKAPCPVLSIPEAGNVAAQITASPTR